MANTADQFKEHYTSGVKLIAYQILHVQPFLFYPDIIQVHTWENMLKHSVAFQKYVQEKWW